MSAQKFSLKRYNKDRKKCYEMSKNGINIDQLSKTEDRIVSKRMNTIKQILHDSTVAQRLAVEASECNKKNTLGLCSLVVKDRCMDMCEYCDTNI